MTINPLLLVLFAGFLTALGNICLKLSRTGETDLTFIESLFNPMFILGLAFYAVNVVIFAKSLEKLSLTVAYPMLTGIGFLFVSIFSVFILGENLTFVRVIGALLIIVGLLLIS